MKRIEITPRQGWQNTIEQQGFLFNEGGNYWKENAAYSFTEAEILAIEKATSEIFAMCCEAVEYVIKREWYDKFFIDRKFGELIPLVVVRRPAFTIWQDGFVIQQRLHQAA